jgi:hypothetical protein
MDIQQAAKMTIDRLPTIYGVDCKFNLFCICQLVNEQKLSLEIVKSHYDRLVHEVEAERDIRKNRNAAAAAGQRPSSRSRPATVDDFNRGVAVQAPPSAAGEIAAGRARRVTRPPRQRRYSSAPTAPATGCVAPRSNVRPDQLRRRSRSS